MVLGYIALTASLAAIMSTTDSLINAISQLITMELFWPAFPNVSPRKIAWAGRITSLVSSCIALLIGIFWKDGITGLVAIQFPLSGKVDVRIIIGFGKLSRVWLLTISYLHILLSTSNASFFVWFVLEEKHGSSSLEYCLWCNLLHNLCHSDHIWVHWEREQSNSHRRGSDRAGYQPSYDCTVGSIS